MAATAAERRYLRRTLNAESEIRVEVSSSPRDVRTGRIKVLGAGGAFLQGCDGYAVGTVVQLRFALPGVEREISCSAIVRGDFPGSGVGVEFTRLNSRHREQIVAIVMRAQTSGVSW